jgi:hypothetical protein
MFDTGTKTDKYGRAFHLVIICDESGIFEAFELTKDKLASSAKVFISLVYTISDKNFNPLFDQELRILEKLHFSILCVNILKIDTSMSFCKQELLEAIINSNTLPVMKFSVFGNRHFVEYIIELLRFLDIKEYQIDSKRI